MTFHPRENRGSRRQFLTLGALAAAAGTGVLAGCGRQREEAAPPSEQVALSRPDKPATLPLHSDVPAIKDGLAPEKGGTLKIFNYPEYISPDVIKAFGEEHGVTVEVTTFTTQDEAIAKLRTAGTAFDVYFPTPDIVGKLVAGKLLQPLNRSYLTNLGNAWPELQDPFYDKGSRYTVPYTAFTTGILYRADRVPTVPANGWDLIWDPAHKGQTYVLDDGREGLSLAMLKVGKTDLNTEDPAVIKAAGEELLKLNSTVNVKVSAGGYQLVAEGQATVHHAWSGDAVNAQSYLGEDVAADVLAYWFPTDRKGPVGTDTIAIPRSAEKPVLAHLFLNHMIDNDIALENFGFTGYQPALSVVTPEKMIADEFIAENLSSAIVSPAHYRDGLQELQLSPAGDRLWLDEWAKFKAGK
ncbi:spermidine/putrescine ABC transporter substrate-binding protein [Virgisporangium ochraceum]|uniref:ABC transporter substrate-binding protein n=1 Tax=Virgisporangium ochraceum TaxID=65505 RepID=A0A8J4A2S2_9ACTN|nr:spermidine/putrescine ABC transporter substrate-binding protein [Virgisporangium ochraceum]GIJ73758.1 ABC transporter substrate-binding protein [Virgisporangium ochraceum]